MDEHQPPTYYPLQPHHIALLYLFDLAFRGYDIKCFEPEFLIYVHRMLLDEVAEAPQPKSALSIKKKLSAAPKNQDGDAPALILAFTTFKLETVEDLITFFSGVPPLFIEKNDDDELPIFARRSLYGYFCRRCFVSFLKLSFSGVVQLHNAFQLWWSGQSTGFGSIPKDQLNNAENYIYKTQSDRQNWADAESYEEWMKAQAVGDETLIKESLRSFFEQRFHEGSDSGVRQLALLNLVRFHYTNGEYTAARKLLSEAISVSRTNGDRLTLQQCISMLHRFPPSVPEQKSPINEIQPNLNPLDILYDVKKLIDEKNEQPLSVSFVKIAQAMGVYDLWLEGHTNTISDSDQWAQHAVQAIVWSAAGCEDLGSVESDLVIAFTEPGGTDNNRISTVLNQAYRRARQGSYDNALAMLLDPSTWQGLAMPDYLLWAQEVWHVLALRATRRGQDRLYREFLLPRHPPGDFDPRTYALQALPTVSSKIADSLYEVMQMRENDQNATAIEPLLKSLWHSEFLFRLNYYRTGIIFLADVGLEFGMSKRCRRMIEDIMPQLITGNDLEQLALAAFTLGRCIIMAEESSSTALQEAVRWLSLAETNFTLLQMYPSVTEVQYLLSVVYNTMGLESERDAAAERHIKSRERQKELETAVVDEEVGEIIGMVSNIGISLSLR